MQSAKNLKNQHYLDILKGGFLLETLQKFLGSVVRQKSSTPKIIAMDPALIHAFSDPRQINSDPDWREGDREVDSVAEFGHEIFGIEVKSG